MKQPQRQVGKSPKELKFKQILQNYQEGSLPEQDWMDLSERFVGTSSDSNDVSLYQNHCVFYDNKSAFDYNMSRLQILEIPIAKLQARHNCSEAKKKDPQEANGLHSCLYLSNGAYVMLTSNLWTAVGLHNVSGGKVIDFVYMKSDGPRSHTFPEDVVMKFSHLEPDMTDFLEDYPGSFSITNITDE